jgi:hypothetical protein
MNSMATENTSGQGAMAVVPREIEGWNWGAFLLTWIWGLGNNVLIALLMFVPMVNIVMWFVLGAKGSEWAWRNKRWDSVEEFRRVQRTWTKWGVIVALASLALATIFAVALFFGVSSLMKNSEPYLTALARMDANPAAMAALGEPAHGGFPSGSISTNNGEGSATLQIPVTGSSKSGTLYVDGTSTGGQWRYQRIELVVSGQHIDLNTGGN